MKVSVVNEETPILELKNIRNGVNLYAKFEGCNIFGSMKERAVRNCLLKAFENKRINHETEIIESSSGNMGIALASMCNELGLKFTCVIDPHITQVNRSILECLNAKLIIADKPDINGGYLLSRLEIVHDYVEKNNNVYWVNQYDNLDIIEGYYKIADEFCNYIKQIDYMFLTVSSGGSIAGISRRMKEISKDTKVIAVDVEGSVIFGYSGKKRYIPGAGSSITASNLEKAIIDDVVIVSEKQAVENCWNYKNTFGLIGGSSGVVLAGIEKYLSEYEVKPNVNIATIFPDRGERYLNSIYNIEWCKKCKLI